MRLLITFFLLIPALSLFAQQKLQYSRVKIYLEERPINDLGRLGIDTDHGYIPEMDVYVSDVDHFELRRVAEAGFRYEVLISNVSEYYRARSEQEVTFITDRSSDCEETVYPVPENFEMGSMGGYLTYDQLLATLDSMVAKYPNLISARQPISDTIITYRDNPIYWLRISDNPTVDEDEPSVLYNSLIHAREPQSLAQLVFYMWYLLENYETDAEVRYLVDHTEMYFVPCVNPDGYLYNEYTDPWGGGLWRKNMRDNYNNGFFDPANDGVDLNRNFSFQWGDGVNGGSSGEFDAWNYRGPAPFSEPETRALRHLCIQQNFHIALNYHSYGHLLIYPFAYSDQLPDPALAHMGEVMTRHNHYHAGTSIQTVGYRVNGDAADWMLGDSISKPPIYSYIPEIGPFDYGFWPPQNAIIPLSQMTVYQNLRAAHLLLNYGEVLSEAPVTINNINDELPIRLTRYGLEEGPLNVELIGLSSNVLTTGPAKQYELEHLEAVTDSLAFSLSPDISYGDTIRFQLRLDNGLFQWEEIIELPFRWSDQPLFDAADDLSNWIITDPRAWELDANEYRSAPYSISLGRPGYRQSNITHTQEISLLDAEAAQLQYWTRWNLRRDRRQIQVLIADADDLDFQPVCGRYTVPIEPNPGLPSTPVYDGLQSTWVQECIDLSDYLGRVIRLRFEFDGWTSFSELEYFNIDDIEVRSYSGDQVSVQSLSEPASRLGLAQPNPADGYSELRVAAGPPARLLVYDILGRLHWQQALLVGATELRLPTASWPAGLYFYQLEEQYGGRSPARRLQVTH